MKALKELDGRVVSDGHAYELENFDKTPPGPGQLLMFIEKVKPNAESQELVTVMNGTTNEEVIKALIHRLGCLSKKFPCRENSLAATKLEEALMWLEKRTSDRIARGVEGKHVA